MRMPWGKHKGEDVGTWEELPCDTFAGTSVRSVLLSVERDKMDAETPGTMASDAGESAE